MTSPEDLREQAKRLYELAKTIDDYGERLHHVLRGLVLEAEADALERTTVSQVQQVGTQPPAPLPTEANQPAQQQQQDQPDKE